MGRGDGEVPEEVISRVQDHWGKSENLILPPTPWWITEWSTWPLPWVTLEDSYTWVQQASPAQHLHWWLLTYSKQLLDASAGGKIKLKTPEEAMELIENMAANDHAILCDRAYTPTKKSLLDFTSQDAMLAQNKILAKTLELSQQLWVISLNSYMQCNLLHLQSCTLGDATSAVMLMSQAHAWSKMMQPTRSTTWEVRIVKDSIKKDHQDSIREEIFLRAKVGDLI